jgi:plastocyanin domain-containing protein
MQKNIIISTIMSVAIVGGMLYFISDNTESLNNREITQSNNVEIKDGVQYVTIEAKGGYSPRLSEIKEGLPTKLIVKTDSTFDCSISLVIRSVDFQKVLQPTGEEVVDLGVPKLGDKIQGVCSMGMYSFQIKVS